MKEMKKLTRVMTASVLALSLAGCGSSTSSTSTSTSSTDSSGSASYTVGIMQYVQHEALDAATEGFKDALTDELGDQVTFDEQNASGETANCSTIANQFVTENVDLILANATPALQAAAAATSDIPILGTSVTDYATALDISDWTGTVGGNISGTSDLAPLDQQADLFKELLPDAQNIGILYCSSEANSVYQADTITTYLEDLGYTVTTYTFSDSNDLQSVCTTACQDSDALYIPTDNTAANNTELIDNVASEAGVPIICGEEGICAGCGIATLSIDYYDLGQQTGKMAAQILTGEEDISTMAVEYADTVTKEYVKDRCDSLGITVPDDYTEIEAE
jgi:putative ABC transport system substrate-binding protein